MYDNIGNEMEDFNVAEQLSEPPWMDQDGNIFDEKQAFGCIKQCIR